MLLEDAKGENRIADDCRDGSTRKKKCFSAGKSPVQEPVVASNVSCVAFNSSIIKIDGQMGT